MKRISTIFIILGFFVFTGCSLTVGKFDANTHFAYPNSNITPLGHVKVATSKSSILIPPDITYNDVKELIDKGIAQKPGADLIINYKVDTTVTSYLGLFYSLEITLQGTAVKMEVGEKELQETIKKSRY